MTNAQPGHRAPGHAPTGNDPDRRARTRLERSGESSQLARLPKRPLPAATKLAVFPRELNTIQAIDARHSHATKLLMRSSRSSRWLRTARRAVLLLAVWGATACTSPTLPLP